MHVSSNVNLKVGVFMFISKYRKEGWRSFAWNVVTGIPFTAITALSAISATVAVLILINV